MNVRRTAAALLSAALLFSLALPASAAPYSRELQADYMDIQVTLDGAPLVLTDANGAGVEPFASGDTTYLPVRAIANALGLGVGWLAETQTVVLKTGGTTSSGGTPVPGSNRTEPIRADYSGINVTLDGKALTLTDASGAPVEPFAVDGTTYLPVRAVANALGLGVEWDTAAHVVRLTTLSSAQGEPQMAAQAEVFVQGLLDQYYRGRYNEDYLALTGLSAAQAESEYLNWLYAEVDYYCYYFSIEYPTEEYIEAVADLYRELYGRARYTVEGAVLLPGGDYGVKVTLEPIDIMLRVTSDDLDRMQDGEEYMAILDLDFDALSDQEYDALYQEYDRLYAGGVLELVRSHLEDMGYGEEQSVIFQVDSDEYGCALTSDKELNDFDELLITYF